MTVDLQTEVQSESLSVVNIAQDGRCFFRCVVASSDPMERTTKRVNGHPAEPDLKLRERVASDSLRSRLMLHILCSIEEHRQTMRGDTLNAYMPSHIQFHDLNGRISAMAANTAMVGEFEIQQTSSMLQKTIIIFDDLSGTTISYGRQFHDSPPVLLNYKRFGDNAGHYDLLVPSTELMSANASSKHPFPLSPVHQGAASARKSKTRKTASEVLTSSPFKRRLEEENAKRQQKKERSGKKSQKSSRVKKTAREENPRAQKRKNQTKGQKHSEKKDLDPNAWHCHLCDECRIENMICCRQCSQWAHTACAATDSVDFICDKCV